MISWNMSVEEFLDSYKSVFSFLSKTKIKSVVENYDYKDIKLLKLSAALFFIFVQKTFT